MANPPDPGAAAASLSSPSGKFTLHGPAWLIGGPTACGKSALALELAQRLGGEIISVDSMQVYRGLDIGTAKPTAEELARVPHHLVDVAGLEEPFDAARFVELASRTHQEIRGRGKIPIYVGGTGLYYKALIEGLGEVPGTNPAIRAELEALPLEQLVQELAVRDPECAAVIDRQNPRRVIRALEVIRTTGQPYSAQRASWAEEGQSLATLQAAGVRCLCLRRPREQLVERINRRVDAMFAQGLVEETRRLLEHGLKNNRTALQAIGYRQVVEYLQGDRSLPETVELVKIKTRQFAKRQMTWWEHQMGWPWVDWPEGASVGQIADQVLGS